MPLRLLSALLLALSLGFAPSCRTAPPAGPRQPVQPPQPRLAQASAQDTVTVLALVLAGSVHRWGAPVRARVPDPCRVAGDTCARAGFWLADSARGQQLLDSLAPHVPPPPTPRVRPGVPHFQLGVPFFRGDSAVVRVGQRGGQPGPGGGGFAADWVVVLGRVAGPVGWTVLGWRLTRIT